MGIQTERPIELLSPLGQDELLFLRMSGHEQLGRPFEYHLELSSKNGAILPDQLLGQAMAIRLNLEDGQKRYFHGIVTRFAQVFRSEDESRYQATLRPWIWLLSRSSDCRIFPPDLTAVDIIKQVFRDHGFSDFEDNLNAEGYRKWEYCVQYRETAFNFVSRLMEQEGICYYHKHQEGKHILVLADSYSSHEPISGYETVPYFSKEEGALRGKDHLYDWNVSHELQTGAYALTDFDFEKPGANLGVQRSVPRPHANSSMEYFDYPGEYDVSADGETYAKIRIEELQAQYEVVRAAGNARGLTSGALFTLSEYPRSDQLKEYLIVGSRYDLENEQYRSGNGSGPTYSIQLEAIDATQPYRTPRITAKPIVQGPQTAIVVGKSGEEIWTDQYGRIKVKFHWDRHGNPNETASCWVRVAQVWAGKNWGGLHIPRIGQEVIVEFLEGDPDRPIVTGCVYNADQMPPYDLPANQTQSGIKSRSSKGGDLETFNEIRFEDLKGSEQMYIHAEKDQVTVVENDQSIAVGNDRHEEIGRDRSLLVHRDKSETVDRNKTIEVGASHAETIRSDMTVSVGANLTETVAINYAETVGAAMELSVGGILAISVGGAMTTTVGLSKSENVGGSKTVSIGANVSESVDGQKTIKIGKDLAQTVTGKHREEAKENFSIQSKKVQVTADEEISLKTGSAEIVMKKNGDITINGKKITIKGSGDVVVKGSNIKEN